MESGIYSRYGNGEGSSHQQSNLLKRAIDENSASGSARKLVKMQKGVQIDPDDPIQMEGLLDELIKEDSGSMSNFRIESSMQNNAIGNSFIYEQSNQRVNGALTNPQDLITDTSQLWETGEFAVVESDTDAVVNSMLNDADILIQNESQRINSTSDNLLKSFHQESFETTDTSRVELEPCNNESFLESNGFSAADIIEIPKELLYNNSNLILNSSQRIASNLRRNTFPSILENRHKIEPVRYISPNPSSTSNADLKKSNAVFKISTSMSQLKGVDNHCIKKNPQLLKNNYNLKESLQNLAYRGIKPSLFQFKKRNLMENGSNFKFSEKKLPFQVKNKLDVSKHLREKNFIVIKKNVSIQKDFAPSIVMKKDAFCQADFSSPIVSNLDAESQTEINFHDLQKDLEEMMQKFKSAPKSELPETPTWKEFVEGQKIEAIEKGKENVQVTSKLERIKKRDLENMIIEQLINKIFTDKEILYQKELCTRLESALAKTTKTARRLLQEVENFKSVTSKLQLEHNRRKDRIRFPNKFKRSVGIHVTSEFIDKSIVNGPSGFDFCIAPSKNYLKPAAISERSSNVALNNFLKKDCDVHPTSRRNVAMKSTAGKLLMDIKMESPLEENIAATTTSVKSFLNDVTPSSRRNVAMKSTSGKLSTDVKVKCEENKNVAVKSTSLQRKIPSQGLLKKGTGEFSPFKIQNMNDKGSRSKMHPAPLPMPPRQEDPKTQRIPAMPILKAMRDKESIILTWALPDDMRGREPVKEYQVFSYEEDDNPPRPSLWKRIGAVAALQLPMACTLDEFQKGKRYHFTIRAVDGAGRIGPFSKPRYIHMR